MKAKYKKWIKWGGIALGAVFLVAATAGIATAVTKNQTEDTRNLTQFDYSCYVLDDITGKVDKTDASNISTNNYYSIDGLKCKLAKEAEITYQLNFYDEEKDFLSMQAYTDDFDGSEIESLKSQGVCYVRVEILPVGDADGEVSVLEKNGYVKQLTVTVEKDTQKDAEADEE